MDLGRKIILHLTSGNLSRLDSTVAEFMAGGVAFVAVVGPRASYVEDLIDEICVGDGTAEPYELLTSSHEGATLQDAIEFSNLLTGEFSGPCRVVEI
jgi:hypothetical protein